MDGPFLRSDAHLVLGTTPRRWPAPHTTRGHGRPLALLLLATALAARASAQSSSTVEFFGGPLETLGAGGEILFLGEQVGKLVGADVELTLTVHEPRPWVFEFAFGLPTGTVVVSSSELGWNGAGTFTTSFSTDALNGWLEPFPGHQAFVGYGAWSGGPLLGGAASSDQAPASVELLDASLDHFAITLHFAPCDPGEAPLAWKSVGGGVAGAAGQPVLEATHEACLLATGELRLLQGPPLAPTWMVLGTERADLPLAGGTLVPAPQWIAGPVLLDAHGSHAWPFAWSTFDLPDLTLWAQAWTVDPTAPGGLAASDGIEAVLGPGP